MEISKDAVMAAALADLKQARPTLWCNPAYLPEEDLLAQGDLAEARSDWLTIAPLLARLFPELAETNGTIASDLIDADAMRPALGYEAPHFGHLFVKADHALPVAGSIKARGGIFEVMMTAVRQARAAGFLGTKDDVTMLAGEAAHAFFSERTIAVGSTGNLGLSVGIAARTLGYNTVVHMSADAKPWKIERLRRFGVKVIQHRGDYNLAVAAARDVASRDPMAYFVDDEDSELLFRGYSAAAHELGDQLQARGITIGPECPLFLYLPCGIGGAPGGVAHGARAVFGPHVHAFFAEPVQSPSALVQMMHGLGKPVSVYDIGLTNSTEADGMAVATMSALVAEKMQTRLAGGFTLGDADMFRLLASAHDALDMMLEPSASIGFAGPHFLLNTEAGHVFSSRHMTASALANGVHIVWTTGGSFVPEAMFNGFLDKGRTLAPHFDFSKDNDR